MSTCKDSIIRTTKDYICSNVIKLTTTQYINVDSEKGEISLTLPAITSNHYLQTDEKAHCKGKWQDWFCIHNYHNNNNINNYPNTNTMSIGVCYNYCVLPSQPKTGEIITKYNKCSEYYDENDIIYNPLAIIAIFGTHFHNNKFEFQEKMPSYDSIEKTIGIRGSYLNDLYRVNKQNEFIKFTYDEITTNFNSATNNQDKLLFNIIKYIINNNKVYIIEEIKEDIKKACNNINNLYLKKIKGKPQQKQDFLSKIKNYVFDIEKLEKLYGKDKNEIQKFINIIAYSYNIMRLVCYQKNALLPLPYDEIKLNLKLILTFNNVDKEELINNDENFDNIVDIFTSACYNCFNINFDVFNNYRIINSLSEDILIRYDKDNIVYFNDEGFIKYNINDSFFVKGITIPYKYDLTYYNDVPFYNHNVLSEYNDNINKIDKILLCLLAFFIGVIIIFLLYWFIFWLKVVAGHRFNFVDKLIYLINFSHLFYKRITFSLLYISCRIFYNFVFYSRSNNSIISLLYKIFNVLFILYLLSYLYSAFIELLNIDYITLLTNINYSNFTVKDASSYSYIPYYILIIYLILIYIYSTYIIKYSLSDSQFDIIANFDADKTISLSFVDYLLLLRYAEEMLKYKPLYPEEDMLKYKLSYHETETENV